MGQLKIGRIIKTNNPVSKFEISVRYMHGDADKYECESVLIDDEKVAIELLESLTEIYSNKNKRRDRSYWCKKCPQFFDEEFIGDDKYNEIYLEWPGDCTCDSMYPAAIVGADICYFDENGIKHEVEYAKN